MPKATQPSQATAGSDPPPPTAGALLRMTYQGIRERQFAAVIGNGFDDLNQPLLNVFLFPSPDRMRPSELAERSNMTKQAMNYLLGQLEARGYLERRAEKAVTAAWCSLPTAGGRCARLSWLSSQRLRRSGRRFSVRGVSTTS